MIKQLYNKSWKRILWAAFIIVTAIISVGYGITWPIGIAEAIPVIIAAIGLIKERKNTSLSTSMFCSTLLSASIVVSGLTMHNIFFLICGFVFLIIFNLKETE